MTNDKGKQYWELFEKTGRVDAYLSYRKQREGNKRHRRDL